MQCAQHENLKQVLLYCHFIVWLRRRRRSKWTCGTIPNFWRLPLPKTQHHHHHKMSDNNSNSNSSSNTSINITLNTTPTEEQINSPTSSLPDTTKTEKVVIVLKAVGNAPILKKSKFKINSTSQFDEVINFIRKLLKLKTDQSLVCTCLFYNKSCNV